MKRILVLDDNVEILTVIEIVLNLANYEVDLINDWKKLFNRVEIFKPNLILLDFYLGDNTGGNLCMELKSRETTRHIPVLMYSASAKHYAEYGADDYIGKPFDINEMTLKISKLLNHDN